MTPLRNAVTDRRPDVSAAAAIADGGDAGLQNVRRVARGFERVELDAFLELELPDVWLVAVIGEVRVGIDQARHDGEASDIDHAGVAAVAELCHRPHRVDLAILHDHAGAGNRIAAGAVNQGPADEYRLHLDRVPCLIDPASRRGDACRPIGLTHAPKRSR